MLGRVKQTGLGAVVVQQDGQTQFGAGSLFTLRHVKPEALDPQNLVAGPWGGARADALHNTGNIPLYFTRYQSPGLTHSGNTPRLLSRYISLPVGKQFQAAFGSK